MVSEAASSVSLAAVAAFFFAASTILVRAGVREAGSLVAMFVSLTVNLVCLWVVVLIFTEPRLELWRWRYFILAGLFAPALGRVFNYEGIDRLGVNVSAPIVYANPLVSVAAAMLFLGERLSPLGLVGGLLVIGGGGLVGSSEGGGRISFNWYDLLFPVAAALLYGGSHVIRKLGIDLVASPLIAAAVTITASWTLAAGYLLWSGTGIDVDGREFVYFSLAGFATSVALPVLYLALEVGLVVFVTPMMNLSPLFVLGMSFLFFRESELFSPRIVVGTLTVIVGITLLTVWG